MTNSQIAAALANCKCAENGIPEHGRCSEFKIELYGKCEFAMSNGEFYNSVGGGMSDDEYFAE